MTEGVATVGCPDRLLERLSAYRRRAGGIKRKALADGVRALSEMFTGGRPPRPGYLARPHLRAAYVLYYLPVNYAKVRLVLRELGRLAPPLPAGSRVLDFGAGPGTASLAALDELKEPKLTLVDIVGEALSDAEWLLAGYARGSLRLRKHPELPTARFHLAIASNVLSENPDPTLVFRLLEDSLEADGHLVLIEPALRESTARLVDVRDRLAAAGHRILAPCAGAARCPMRGREDVWCHQDRPWRRPSTVDEIDQMLGFEKESLKFSYLIVTRRPDAAPPAGTWRVVSNLHREKGKSWAWLCGPSEELVRAEMLTRHRGHDTWDFFRARRGDLLRIEPAPAGRMSEGTVVRSARESADPPIRPSADPLDTRDGRPSRHLQGPGSES